MRPVTALLRNRTDVYNRPKKRGENDKNDNSKTKAPDVHTSSRFAASSEGANRVPRDRMTAFCRAVVRGRLTILPLPISNSSPLLGISVKPYPNNEFSFSRPYPVPRG